TSGGLALCGLLMVPYPRPPDLPCRHGRNGTRAHPPNPARPRGAEPRCSERSAGRARRAHDVGMLDVAVVDDDVDALVWANRLLVPELALDPAGLVCLAQQIGGAARRAVTSSGTPQHDLPIHV